MSYRTIVGTQPCQTNEDTNNSAAKAGMERDAAEEEYSMRGFWDF